MWLMRLDLGPRGDVSTLFVPNNLRRENHKLKAKKYQNLKLINKILRNRQVNTNTTKICSVSYFRILIS